LVVTKAINSTSVVDLEMIDCFFFSTYCSSI
jgi:hypothetical protein